MSVAPFAGDRRLYPREAASEAVRLVAPSGHAYDAVVVDRSLRGLRVQLEAAGTLPSEVTVLSRSTGAAHVARVVWRTASYAGLSISRTVDMRTASGSESAGLLKLWREHIAR